MAAAKSTAKVRDQGKWGREPHPALLLGSEEEVAERGYDSIMAGPDAINPAPVRPPSSDRRATKESSKASSP